MKKKGFTLVELLAVIAILSLLVVIALPNVMNMFNEAKQKSFETELTEIYKTAQQQWIADSMYRTESKVYVRSKTGNCSSELALNGRRELEFYIKFDKSGNVIIYYAEDGTYQYEYVGTGLKIDQIKNSVQISKIEDTNILNINNCMPYVGGNEVVQTSTFTIDGTTYNYVEGMTFGEWMNSIYAPVTFSISNIDYVSEYNGTPTTYYLDNQKDGISTGQNRWYCAPRHYLTSYDPVYNMTLNRYVFLEDVIDSNYNYVIWGTAC